MNYENDLVNIILVSLFAMLFGNELFANITKS